MYMDDIILLSTNLTELKIQIDIILKFNKELLTIKEDIPEESSRRKIWEYIKSTPHFNAIQVKYAYAITGHKAQGGQWDCVFIDQSFFKKEWLTVDYLRWLYTCFTRAKKKLYLVNFKFDFNKKPEF